MNESAGDHLTELLSNDLDLNDIDDLETTDDAESDEEPRSREGLPSSFRMRHDAHYVDELMSRTPFVPAALERELRPRGPAAPVAAPGRPEPSPASTTPAPVAHSGVSALALVASRLDSVVSHADGIRADHGTSLLVAHSVQVEFARVGRLARAAVILEKREPPVRRTVIVSHVAERVRRASAAVARIGGFEFSLTLGDPTFTVLAESGQVVQAIAGTVDALVDLLLADARGAAMDEEGTAARISIALHSVKVRPALIVDVSCPALFLDEAQAGRFFENAPDDYRAAPAAGVLLAAAAHIARAHGGRADVKPQPGAGVTITYVFPQVIAEHPAF